MAGGNGAITKDDRKTKDTSRRTRTQGRIAFANLVPPPRLPRGVTLAEAFRDSLVTGTVIERYNRDWRMGPSRQVMNDVVGRIGFERVAGVAELWDERSQDFRTSSLREGTTSPFVVHLPSQRIAFQRRPGVIERYSFTGALSALLNEASPYPGWEVEPDIRPVEFEGWVEDVDRVTKLLIRIQRPNPNYQGRDRVKRIIENANAQLVTLTVQAAKDDPTGVAIDEALIAEAIEHAAAGYGYIKAEGTQEVSGKVVAAPKYDSKRQGAAPERTVPADPQTKDVTTEDLRREAHRPPDAT